MVMRRVTTAICFVMLVGCRVPVHVQSVADAPSAAHGVPAPRAASPARAVPVPIDGARGASGGRDAAGVRVPDGLDFDTANMGSMPRLELYADPSLGAFQQDPQAPARQEPAEPRWSDFLPIGRESVLAAGYELPRAFGFGIAYTHLRRDIEVTEVRVGIDGAPPQTVGFLGVEADSVVDNLMGRLDAWIFPFWNVSLLGGWTWNESTSQVTVNVPFPVNPRSVTFDVPTKQDGPTWGFGTNLAAGYGHWFVSGDGQWIRADMSDFAVIEAFLGSIRSGWHGKIDGVPVRFWGGATHWDTATTIKGNVSTADGQLRFEVDQGPVTPYTLQVGGSVEFEEAYGVFVEFHMLRDVRMLVVSAALRF